MINKSFKMVFPYVDDLRKYGKENLLNSLLDVINDIDDKYIFKVNGVSEGLYNLFGFNNYDELKINLHHKNMFKLKHYLNIIVNNIFNSLEEKNSLIRKLFKDYTGDRDICIEFK